MAISNILMRNDRTDATAQIRPSLLTRTAPYQVFNQVFDLLTRLPESGHAARAAENSVSLTADDCF